MDAKAQTETLATSYIPEGTRAPARLSPEQQRARERGKDLRDIYEKVKNTDPVSALRRPEGLPLLSSLNTGREIDRRIREREDPADPDRRTEGTKLASELKIVAEKGLDGIVDASGNPDLARQQAIIDDYIAEVLELRPGFAALGADEKKAIAKSALQSQEFKSMVASVLTEILPPGGEAETEETTTYKKLKTERDEEEEARKEAKKKVKKAAKELDKLKQIQIEHQPGGARATEIQNLANGLDVVDYRNNITDLQQIGADGFAGLKADVTTKRNAGIITFTGAEQQMNQIIQYEIDSGKSNGLAAERDGIADKIKVQQKDLRKLEKERGKFRKNISEKDEDIEDIEDTLTEQEDTLLTRLKGAYTEAGNRLLDDDLEKRRTAQQEQLTKEAAEANDRDNQVLLEGYKTRWSRIEVKNGRPRPVYNKTRLDRDNILVLTSNGDISAEIASILKAKLAPDPSDTPEEAARKAEEITRIDTRLKEDPEFVKSASADFVKNLLAQRLAAGKLPFEGEIRIFDANGWGSCLEQAIDQDNALKQRIDVATNSLGGGPDRIDRLKREFGSNWLAILAMLLAGTVAPAFIATKLAAKEMGR